MNCTNVIILAKTKFQM